MKLISMAVTALILVACNKSEVPLDTLAAAPFDSSLVGLWRQLEPDNDSVYLSILEFRAPEYLIEANTAEGAAPLSDDPPYHARGYITRVGGVNFMNIDDLNSSPRGYVLYQYRVSRDTLIAYELNEAAHKFKTSAELRSYVVANLRSDLLYARKNGGKATEAPEEMKFVRVELPEKKSTF